MLEADPECRIKFSEIKPFFSQSWLLPHETNVPAFIFIDPAFYEPFRSSSSSPVNMIPALSTSTTNIISSFTPPFTMARRRSVVSSEGLLSIGSAAA